jgi:tRNA threonylcarbamoyladenosine biosynthesis protein TsaB
VREGHGSQVTGHGTVRVLALETATPYLSVGLLEVNGDLEMIKLERAERVERAHAELALGCVQDIFLEANLEPRADVIAVGTGPGSYTGVRVAASLALGLARAWNAVVIGVPTLNVIAAAHDGLVAVTWDARKGNVYSAVYCVAHGSILETPVGIEKRTLENFEKLIPDGALLVRDEAPSGIALARLGLERFRRGEIGELELSYL